MNQLLYYDKKKHLKVCLIGTIVGLLFALNTIFNASSTFSITIGHFCYKEPLPGSSIFAYLIYVLVVVIFFGGVINGFYCLSKWWKKREKVIKIICIIFFGLMILIRALFGMITLIPLVVYDIYYLIKMKKVEKYFGRNI